METSAVSGRIKPFLFVRFCPPSISATPRTGRFEFIRKGGQLAAFPFFLQQLICRLTSYNLSPTLLSSQEAVPGKVYFPRTMRSTLQIGAVSAILGPIVFGLATWLHPMQADPNDPVAAFTEYAAATIWVASHLGQFFGFLIMAASLVALYSLFPTGAGKAIAQLALVTAVVSVATFAVLQAVDGIALKMMVDAWNEAPVGEKTAIFQAALAVRQIEIGLASLWSLTTGIAILLYGFAVSFSNGLPRWSGWVAVVVGAGTAAGGVVIAYTGFSTQAMNLNHVTSLAVIAWIVGMGVLMWRRAGTISE